MYLKKKGIARINKSISKREITKVNILHYREQVSSVRIKTEYLIP